MTPDIALHTAVGESDIVHRFIVYKLNSFPSNYWVSNGVLRYDNTVFDKFMGYSHYGDLLIAGTTNGYILIRCNKSNYRNTIVPLQAKAIALELNEWIRLSIHCNAPGCNNSSIVYCNGTHICEFTSRTSFRSNQVTFGDLNPSDISGMDRSIKLL